MKGKIIGFVLVILVWTDVSAQIRYNYNRRQSNDIEINYSNPKEYVIANIEVLGSKFLDKNALISISGLKIGDKIKIPGDAISGGIKKLWKQGIIGDVKIYANKIEGEEVSITIELSERPRLTRFAFEGLTRTQEKDIREKINLIRGRVITDALVRNAELTITRYFADKGYLDADVKVVQQQDTLLSNSIQLNVMVDKKRKIKVNKINIIGDTIFADAKLKGQLKKTGEKPRISVFEDLAKKTFSLFKPKELKEFITTKEKVDPKEYINTHVKLNIFKSNKYIESDFETDKAGLITFYNSKGYRDAAIIDDSVYLYNNKSVNLDLEVEPGQQYYFRDIIWSGNYVYQDITLNNVLGINKGDVYDLELVNKKLNYNPTGTDISSLYMDNGYLFFSVNPVEVRIEDDSIDLEMRIYEGAQAKISKVMISGNDRTSDHVILRELRTLPGDYFSRAELIRTQRELSQLGYFDPEQVNPVPMPNPADETVDIQWNLVERPSDQVELSGGWGGAFGFVGTLGLVFNNFSLRNIANFDKWRPLPVGDGQRLSIRMQANGRRFQSYTFSFSEPWLGGRKPNNFGVNYSYSVQRSVNTITNEVFGSLKVQGITLSLGRRIKWPDDYFTLSNSLSYLNYDLFNFGQTLGFETGVSNNINFNTTLARNSIDNPMFPRSGSSISLSLALTPPYSLWNDLDFDTAPPEERYKWVEYHKWMFDAKFYTKLVGNLVLETRAHMGYIGSYNDKSEVGPFERFFVGGDGLTGQNFLLGNDIIGLRGYENNSIVPPADENGIQGGTVYNKFVFELRYPLSLNPSATIYVTSFLEAGNNWSETNNFNPYDLYRSAGFGARIFMPAFGLLGVDWGYGFDVPPGGIGISGPQFHFSIGQQLR
ncbi:MAG: POTRA domain-containing protein [Cyclobacteriaceae bacterium]